LSFAGSPIGWVQPFKFYRSNAECNSTLIVVGD
jgi:hypothetical protein